MDGSAPTGSHLLDHLADSDAPFAAAGLARRDQRFAHCIGQGGWHLQEGPRITDSSDS